MLNLLFPSLPKVALAMVLFLALPLRLFRKSVRRYTIELFVVYTLVNHWLIISY